MKNAVRLGGAIVGAVGGVLAFHLVGGLWGCLAGVVVFLGCTSLSERFWRRRASSEEIRQDLESRARDTLP